jgi:hypothetical protein
VTAAESLPQATSLSARKTRHAFERRRRSAELLAELTP